MTKSILIIYYYMEVTYNNKSIKKLNFNNLQKYYLIIKYIITTIYY